MLMGVASGIPCRALIWPSNAWYCPARLASTPFAASAASLAPARVNQRSRTLLSAAGAISIDPLLDAGRGQASVEFLNCGCGVPECRDGTEHPARMHHSPGRFVRQHACELRPIIAANPAVSRLVAELVHRGSPDASKRLPWVQKVNQVLGRAIGRSGLPCGDPGTVGLELFPGIAVVRW